MTVFFLLTKAGFRDNICPSKKLRSNITWKVLSNTKKQHFNAATFLPNASY